MVLDVHAAFAFARGSIWPADLGVRKLDRPMIFELDEADWPMIFELDEAEFFERSSTISYVIYK